MVDQVDQCFIDERHTLYVGWVLGCAWRNGVKAQPVLDGDGNYTARLALPLGLDGVSITVLVPYPPDDWPRGG